MVEPEKNPKSELSSGLRGEILKWVVLGLLGSISVPALFWGVPVWYGMDEEKEKTIREYSEKLQEQRKRSTAVAEYALNVADPAFRRSTERAEQVRKLDWSKNGKISPAAAQEWHKTSANARREASKDLGSLSGAPVSMAPSAGELKKNVEDLIQAEIAAWECIDAYVTAKSEGQDSDKTFDALLKSLANYQRFVTAYGPTLVLAEKEGILSAEEDTKKDEHDFHETMAKLKERLNFAKAAIGAAAVIIISMFLYLFWPRIRREKPPSRIILGRQ